MSECQNARMSESQNARMSVSKTAADTIHIISATAASLDVSARSSGNVLKGRVELVEAPLRSCRCFTTTFTTRSGTTT